MSKIPDPKTLEERREAAKKCEAEMRLGVPYVVDGMDDAVAKAWNARPDRIFIVTPDGKVAYRGERGPRGFKPAEMEKRLVTMLDGDD
jgi:hypothetical protein